MHSLLVLGGYGFFGSQICKALSQDKHIRLLIGGRDAANAQKLADDLALPKHQGIAVDTKDFALSRQLLELNVTTVVHAAGPFQGQDYHVARAAITAGANYIDIADGREFVCGISQLDSQARARGVLVTSGASSVPALSAAVVDRHLPRFSRLQVIRHAIGSGGRAPGLATLRGVFAYCGKPIRRLEDGIWKSTWGWMDTRRHEFPAPMGRRYLGSCDIPDLDLFPRRYQDVHTVTFHAGFAHPFGHFAVWLGACCVRLGLIDSFAPYAPALHGKSLHLEPWLSCNSGMVVEMIGLDLAGQPLTLVWYLLAANNEGTRIPCAAAIALARRLARDDNLPSGAMPCMGLVTVEEYLGALGDCAIREVAP